MADNLSPVKQLLTILFFIPLIGISQKCQVSIQKSDSAMTLPQVSIPLTTCVSYFGKISGYSWTNAGGNAVTFALNGTTSTIISGFKPGFTKIKFTVNGSAGPVSDSLTLTFAKAPVIPPPIPCPTVDSAGIIKAYLIAHPCPTCPSPRTVTQRTTTHNGSGKDIDLYTYSDGGTSSL